MKRPSFQFYPADWRNNAKLRRCSEAARGAWMDVLCVLHDSDEYGVVRWPLADLARAAGVPLKLVKELHEKDVLKGGDKGCEPYIYTPVSGRVKGDPVILVESKDGKPCWYCSRFVRDEYIRQRRGNGSQFTSDNQPPKAPQNNTPKASPKPPIGERQGDGSTSTSTSTKETVVVKDTGVVSENSGQSPSPPPQDHFSNTKFAMHPEWEPSNNFDSLCVSAGMRIGDTPPVDQLYEFRTYWLTRPDVSLNQAGWEHKFIKNLMAEKARAAK